MILILVENTDFSVFYALIATNTELSDSIQYPWLPIKHNRPSQNKKRAY